MLYHFLCYIALYIVGYITCDIICYAQAGLLDPLDTQSASFFTSSELLIQEDVRKYKNGAAELKYLIWLYDLTLGSSLGCGVTAGVSSARLQLLRQSLS